MSSAAWVLLPLAAYLLGTFPSAVWIARSKGVDITAVGSGNPGASNIARTFGQWWGILVFVLDGLKGALPALLSHALGNTGLGWAMVAAAVLGHMFPVTRGFRGGKGVATMGGASLAMQPLPSLVMLVLWVVVRKSTTKASLASLSIMVCFPIAVAVRGVPAHELVAIVAIDLLVLLRHLDNIKRLLGGSELSASHGS
ncbi:MAG: glycerol-3-phosphate 1-O-acyltransferase PlsY [Ilumatobacteraceae bacterium]